MAPTGFGDSSLPSLPDTIQRVLTRLYAGIALPSQPLSDKHKSKTERNAEICAKYKAGETLEKIAEAFGISLQRVHQIVQRQGH